MLKDISVPNSDFSLPEPPTKALTNRERLELIRELRKQPLTNGVVWFFIPPSWLSDWELLCEQKPDDVATEYRCINTAVITGVSVREPSFQAMGLPSEFIEGISTYRIVSRGVWSRLLDW